MRPFEILLLLASAAMTLRAAILPSAHWPDWSPVIPIAIVVLLALHVALEGWRDEMVAGYFVATVVSLLVVMPPVSPYPVTERLLGIGGSTLLFATAGLCALRPVVQLPRPSGTFAVGTTVAPLLPGKSGASPTFRLWYPAREGTGLGSAPYAVETRGAPRRIRLGSSRATAEASLASAPDRFPVLLFFPGWGGAPSQNAVLLQDLASHGYVVAAADAWDPRAYPGDATASSDLATGLVFESDASAATAMAAGARNAVRQARLARRLIDRLAALDAAGQFAGRLDLDRIGMLGFSFGGSVAVETALNEPRLRAVANLDGGVFTDAYVRGFHQPYLMMSSRPMTPDDLHSPDPVVRREAEPTLEDEARLLHFLTCWGGMRVIINDFVHGDFTDAPLLYDLRRFGGTVDPERARALVNAFLLTFFDHTLRGEPVAVLDGLSDDYPEASVQIWQRATAPDPALRKPACVS